MSKMNKKFQRKKAKEKLVDELGFKFKHFHRIEESSWQALLNKIVEVVETSKEFKFLLKEKQNDMSRDSKAGRKLSETKSSSK